MHDTSANHVSAGPGLADARLSQRGSGRPACLAAAGASRPSQERLGTAGGAVCEALEAVQQVMSLFAPVLLE